MTARGSLRFVGGRTLLVLATGAAFGLAQSIVEPILAVLLQVTLLRAGLANGARMPAVLRDVADSTTTLVALFAIVAVIRTGAQFGAAQCAVVARAQIDARLRNAAADKVLGEPFASLTPATDVFTQISDVFPRATALWQNGVSLLSYALQATTITAVLLWLSPGFAAIAIALFAACAIVVRALGHRADHLSRRLGDEHRAVLADFERAARHRPLVKVLAMEEEERRTVARDVDRAEGTIVRAYALVHASGALGPLVAMGLVIALVVPGPAGWAHGPAGLVTFLFLFVRLGQIGGSIGSAFTGVRASWLPWLRAITWLGERGQAGEASLPSAPSRVERPAAPPAVEVEDLHVAYPGHDDVVTGVAFRVAPGALVGVRGQTGCGKTTLLYAILGLVAPRRGALRIDAETPADYVARGAVGYVGADGGVFAGTLRANLTYGHAISGAPPSDTELADALERARATDVAVPTLGGLDRLVGEGGEGLSAGERQRVALARALLRRPRLLVLDEPTANVDPRTEALIADALVALRGATTCIVVAHREALLRKCDLVLSMTDGRLDAGAAPAGPAPVCASEGPAVGSPPGAP